MTDSFDFVIVGAGSAGCVVAARLAEAGHTVCLLEAGPADRNPMIHMPAGFIRAVSNPRLTWGFTSSPVPGANGRALSLVQGKVLGGSGSINGMVYNRCQRADYDAWAAAGNSGWGFDDVLPWFRKSERRIGAGDDRFRGRDGPMAVTDAVFPNPLYRAFAEAAEQLGSRQTEDYNGESQDGVGPFQFTIDTSRGPARRVSAAGAFLRPAMRTRRLTVRTGCMVEAIELEDCRARGVRYRRGNGRGPAARVHARSEVVVSAGALNTPRLLQLSGIGSGAQLASIGRAVSIDLPGVGANLADHFQVRLAARLRGVSTINQRASGVRMIAEIVRWLAGRPSILALSPVQMRLFHRSTAGLDRPDLQMSFTPASFREGQTGRLDAYPGMTIGGYQQRPCSRGHVRALTTDPFDQPEIQPNYLDDARDCAAIIEVVRMARRLIHSRPFAPYLVAETFPGEAVGDSDEAILDFARRHGATAYHHSGTARMGPRSDRLAVVDPRLRLHGAAGLRVADTSIMPSPVSGNTNAPAIMIGEKAADMILADART